MNEYSRSALGSRPPARADLRSVRAREPLILLAIMMVALGVSAVHPYDRATWWMEVAPIFLGVPILLLTWRRFPLTPLAYRLIFIHCLILMLGGHYTYARVPLGYWMQHAFGFARNHYDRIGHVAQGFIPAILIRETLIRHTPLRQRGWIFFLVASVALAISACYEFIEWWAALAGGAAATDFLGTQGDPWDTQWDMLLALLGACAAQLLLATKHDGEIAAMT